MIYGIQKRIVNALLLATILLFFPLISLAIDFPPGGGGNGATGSGDTGITYVCSSGAPGECTFEDLVKATMKVVNWGTIFALEFSVVVIAFAGFKYMTSGGSPGERAKANKMLISVAYGIAFILAAWLIVTLITKGLGVQTNTFLG